MKRIFKRIFKIALLTFLAAVLSITIIILFPQSLFANKISYKDFTVYSIDKIDENIKMVLENELTLVQKSELYDSKYTYNIILCNNSFYNKIDDKLFGNGPAALSRGHNVIIKVRIDPTSNLAFPTFHKECEENLAELIAHEMTHCLQTNRYGILKFNPFKHPVLWKLEGYPEYISKHEELSSNNYSLKGDIDRYITLESKATDIWILAQANGCEVPSYYYKGRLMIEYLMDIKHLSYDQILKDTTSEKTLFQEMIRWDKSNKGIKK